MATLQRPQEQRVVLRNASWETYERLLAERGENAAPRFTYDRGMLEIMSPLLPEHEETSRNIELLMGALTEELDVDVRSFGSMTLKREDIQRGLEPDGCYYIQHEASIRGKSRIDLAVDPPPDLVVEIDITNPSLDKLPVYARFGVPEVWRYDSRSLKIYVLEDDQYNESPESRVLAGVTADALERLLGARKHLGSSQWLRRVRAWARDLDK